MSTTFEEILSYIKGTGSSDAPGGREAHKKLLGVEGLIIGPDLDIFTLGAEDGMACIGFVASNTNSWYELMPLPQ